MILSSLNTVVISMLCNLFMDVSQIMILSVINILTNMIKGGLLIFATITTFVYIAVLKRRYWINLLKSFTKKAEKLFVKIYKKLVLFLEI